MKRYIDHDRLIRLKQKVDYHLYTIILWDGCDGPRKPALYAATRKARSAAQRLAWQANVGEDSPAVDAAAIIYQKLLEVKP